MSDKLNILFPVGRLVMGSLYKFQDKDVDGRPLVIKSGPNAGKPTVKYFFASAIAKEAGHTHWSQTAWGARIWAFAHAAWPQGQAQTPSFAFKIEDGDSQIPNKRGRKNAEREGLPGCWIVSFSSSFAPKIFTADGSAPILEPDAVKLGYFVEVMGSVSSNESASTPGLYINHNMVALRGYGAEIRTGPDPAAVGFGKAALPAGASAAPVGAAQFPVSPGVPGAPVPTAPPAPVAFPSPVAPSAAPVAVAPHPGFIAPPVPGARPAPPPAAAAPPAPAPVAVGPTMTAKAAGTSYAAFIAAGWNDGSLRQHGYLV